MLGEGCCGALTWRGMMGSRGFEGGGECLMRVVQYVLSRGGNILTVD